MGESDAASADGQAITAPQSAVDTAKSTLSGDARMDSMAFIGFPVAERYFACDGHPTELFLRTVPTEVQQVAAVLAETVDPEEPSTVQWTLPAEILQAELATKGGLNGLLLGLGAFALLVGGVGIASVMVISVLERRRR